jgi:hypothetical protein
LEKHPTQGWGGHEKKVKGRTWRWCKHHMAWGNHKEGDCSICKECINKQNSGLNQVVAKAALATIINPEWQAQMAIMARYMADI